MLPALPLVQPLQQPPCTITCAQYKQCYCLTCALLCPTQVSSINKGPGRSREQRILVMVVVMVVCFLLCWLPYAAVALIATFGKPGLITPAASIIPAILAKSSTVYNPIIYVFLNKQVSEMLSFVHSGSGYARSEEIARGENKTISDITQIH